MSARQSDRSQTGSPRGAFSLVEACLVVAIIGVLAAFTLAAVQKARASADLTQCANNLRQIGLAAHGYHDYVRNFPAGVRYRNGSDPYSLMTWLTQLLPYIERQDLWAVTADAYARSQWPLRNPPHVGLATVVPGFTCPSDSRADQPQLAERENIRVALTSYLGVAGINLDSQDGVLFRDSCIRLSAIKDGASETLFAGERPASADFQFGWWYAGAGQLFTGSADSVLGVNEINAIGTLLPLPCAIGPYSFSPGTASEQCDMFHFWSMHSGGANFLFADGAVRFLPYSAAAVLPALATRAGDDVAATGFE